MKATCIVGSARSHGSTACLIDSLIRGMEEQGIQCVKYCLGEMDIRYCQGCKRCYQTGQCPQQDDVARIVEDILSSDVVAIAAPSYWGYVPGQLKTFFDRNTPYGDTNLLRAQQAHQPIRGIAIAVRAGKTEPENLAILDAIDHYFGHLGIAPFRRFSICQTDTLSDLLQCHQAELDELYQLGKSL